MYVLFPSIYSLSGYFSSLFPSPVVVLIFTSRSSSRRETHHDTTPKKQQQTNIFTSSSPRIFFFPKSNSFLTSLTLSLPLLFPQRHTWGNKGERNAQGGNSTREKSPINLPIFVYIGENTSVKMASRDRFGAAFELPGSVTRGGSMEQKSIAAEALAGDFESFRKRDLGRF